MPSRWCKICICFGDYRVKVSGSSERNPRSKMQRWKTANTDRDNQHLYLSLGAWKYRRGTMFGFLAWNHWSRSQDQLEESTPGFCVHEDRNLCVIRRKGELARGRTTTCGAGRRDCDWLGTVAYSFLILLIATRISLFRWEYSVLAFDCRISSAQDGGPN